MANSMRHRPQRSGRARQPCSIAAARRQTQRKGEPMELPQTGGVPVWRAALRDLPFPNHGLHLPLHRLPAHDQQRLLARMRSTAR
jgi:hypothetical protein